MTTMRGIARRWSAIALRGAIAGAFGIAALVWPDLTVGLLIAIFAAFAIAYGVVAVVRALVARKEGERWAGELLEGLVAVAAGLFVVVWPDLTATGVLVVIGVFAAAVGVTELLAAYGLRNVLRRSWPLALSGVASIAFGALLLSQSSEGAVALAWLIGLYAIIFGLTLISAAMALRDLDHTLQRSA